MAVRQPLSSGDREFFRLVSRAAFTNPFSPERIEIDRKIVGSDSHVSREEMISQMIGRVSQRIQRLDHDGTTRVAMYTREDQRLLRIAFLFELFHRYVPQFDALIRKQLDAVARPVAVPFAGELLQGLAERGFDEDESVKNIGLFYQLRRAYYLIYQNLIGRSPSMTKLRLRLWHNVFTYDTLRYETHLWNRMEDFSTLLLGETGTGKGAAAAAIGRAGFIPYDQARQRFAESFTETFRSTNLSLFSEALLESELFGHRKGAFTGAIEQHEGLLSRCSPHGAIFLDEIGDVSTPAQIKLLKVLEDRVFCPVGSHDWVRFKGRIIAATNQDIDRLREEGRFRHDFYYRLCSDTIQVPPLRQRIREDPQELDDMIGHLVRRLVGGDAPDLAQLAWESLAESPGPDYDWPGNVRELEQAIRRILLNRRYEADRREAASMDDSIVEGIRDGSFTAPDLLRAYCRLLYRDHQSYTEVARITNLDRRTVKKYVERQPELEPMT